VFDFDASVSRQATDLSNARRWVLRNGGIAFCVGKPMRIPGVRVVEGPVDLARAVRELAVAET
jgi:hypothetical protein